MSKWNKLNGAVFREKIKETWESLHQAQETNDRSAEQELQQKHEMLMIIKEQYWWQRFRINWIQAGDRNTSYFHRKAINRRTKDFIKCLQSSNVHVVAFDDRIKEILMQHFQSLFTVEYIDMDLLNAITVPKLFMKHKALPKVEVTNTKFIMLSNSLEPGRP